MNIEGARVSTTKSTKELFDFFINVKNFEQLMPENTQKFEVEGESFLFALKGMPEIRMVLKEKTPNSQVVLGSASSKLSFFLTAQITEAPENKSDAQLIFKGDFNSMMAMMVKKPLTSFINTLTQNIAKL